MRVDSALQQAAIQAVSRAAAATGVDFGALLETAKRESGLDAKAQAKTSSAAGMFQFIESTWLDLVQKYGPKHGLGAIDVQDPRQRKALLDLRYDPEIAGRMAGELTRENAAVLESKLGRAPSAGELYAAHVLGAEGAATVIKADDNVSAAALLPKAAAANHTLFYEPSGAARSARALLEKLQVGGAASASAPLAPPPTTTAMRLTSAAALTALSAWSENFGADLWALAIHAYRGKND